MSAERFFAIIGVLSTLIAVALFFGYLAARARVWSEQEFQEQSEPMPENHDIARARMKVAQTAAKKKRKHS